MIPPVTTFAALTAMSTLYPPNSLVFSPASRTRIPDTTSYPTFGLLDEQSPKECNLCGPPAEQLTLQAPSSFLRAWIDCPRLDGIIFTDHWIVNDIFDLRLIVMDVENHLQMRIDITTLVLSGVMCYYVTHSCKL